MEIRFKDNKIKSICSTKAKAIIEIGAEKTRTLFFRLQQIEAAISLDELKCIPGKFHELGGDRKGQWSCSLNANWRLVFTPIEEEAILIAIIEEITDYH